MEINPGQPINIQFAAVAVGLFLASLGVVALLIGAFLRGCRELREEDEAPAEASALHPARHLGSSYADVALPTGPSRAEVRAMWPRDAGVGRQNGAAHPAVYRGSHTPSSPLNARQRAQLIRLARKYHEIRIRSSVDPWGGNGGAA